MGVPEIEFLETASVAAKPLAGESVEHFRLGWNSMLGKGSREMLKRVAIWSGAVIAVSVFSMVAHAQTAATKSKMEENSKWNNDTPPRSAYAGKKSAPAPVHDISGIWDAMAEGGVQPKGPKEYPDDPKHVGMDVPYTTAGKAARALNRPSEGEEQVPVGTTNDPIDSCEPQGFPRMELYDFRVGQIMQNKNQVVFMDELDANYRVVWTDGRALPKDPEPRWFGYSVGKWIDDTTLQVETVGLDDRTWIDHVGRPHSDQLHVTETYHRADYNTLELTMTITDPVMYTKPWMTLNKFVLHRLPDDFDMREYICSPSEADQYRKAIAAPVAH